MAQVADLPARFGPAEFDMLGGMVAVRGPRELDPLMKKAGGMWEPQDALESVLMDPPGDLPLSIEDGARPRSI